MLTAVSVKLHKQSGNLSVTANKRSEDQHVCYLGMFCNAFAYMLQNLIQQAKSSLSLPFREALCTAQSLHEL
jgi:hypothetical protein